MNFFRALFHSGLRAFKALFKAALPIAKQIAIGMLREEAMKHVKLQQENPNSGEEKSAAVAAVLDNYAKAHSIPVDGNDIMLAIKLAVSAMRNKK